MGDCFFFLPVSRSKSCIVFKFTCDKPKITTPLIILGLINFLVPINILSFVFSPYKIKSHFLVPVTFSLNILGIKNVDEIFLQGLKMLMKFFYRD